MVIFIIKTIGLVLLGIIVLVLLLSCYLLFAPFGYRVYFNVSDNKAAVRASTHDALRFASVRFCFSEGEKVSSVRLFWGLLKKDGRHLDDLEEAFLEDEAEADEASDVDTTAGGDKAPEKAADGTPTADMGTPEETETSEEDIKGTLPEDTGTKADGAADTDAGSGGDITPEEAPDGESAVDASFERAVTEEALASAGQVDVKRDHPKEAQGEPKGIIDRIEGAAAKLSAIKKEISDMRNQKAVRFALAHAIAVLKRICPRIHKADMTYGFDEPHLTGELTGVLALCPVVYKRRVRLVPDFTADKIYMDGFVDLRGEVQIYVFLVCAAKIFFNRDCRRLYRRIKRLRRNSR